MPTWAPPPQQQTGEVPPKRPGRPATSKPTTKGSLKAEIGGLIMSLNVLIMMVPPISNDRLDIVEMEALAEALDDQCKRSDRFRKMMENALAGSAGASLLGVVGIISARRAARHRLIGGEQAPEIDQELGNLLARGMDASMKARRASGLA